MHLLCLSLPIPEYAPAVHWRLDQQDFSWSTDSNDAEGKLVKIDRL